MNKKAVPFGTAFVLSRVMENLKLSYNAEFELPVPLEWRETLGFIVKAFNAPNPSKELAGIEGVKLREDIIQISLGQIEDYPAALVCVGPKTWERSIYLWQEGYWDVLVDLHVDDELDEVSDLVLPVKVTLNEGSTFFEPKFIHVP